MINNHTPNRQELSRIQSLLDKARQTNNYSVMSSYEDRLNKLRFLYTVEKEKGAPLPLLQFHIDWADYLQSLGYSGKPKAYRDIAEFLKTK
jgi:hypothetical protein